MCFECPNDSPYYGLENGVCLAACDGEILLDHSANLTFCRSESIIYIDQRSALNIELGTIDFPYKTLESALNEMMNF